MNDSNDANDSDCDRRLIAGWQGRYYEDFEVGDIYKHPYGRTVTETDNVWFTNVIMNRNPMHFNEAHAATTEFDERLVDGTYVIALAVGMSVIDVSVNATANLGYETSAITPPSTTATRCSPRAKCARSARANHVTTSARHH